VNLSEVRRALLRDVVLSIYSIRSLRALARAWAAYIYIYVFYATRTGPRRTHRERWRTEE